MPDWQHLLFIQVDSGDAAVSVVWSELQFVFMVHLQPSATILLDRVLQPGLSSGVGSPDWLNVI